MSELNSLTGALVGKAKDALCCAEADDTPAFMHSLEGYLSSFDSWEKIVLQSKLPDDAGFQEKLQELYQLHQKMLTVAQEKKDQVLGRLGDIKRRKKALRTYIDRYPSRISITGKREV